MLGANLEFSEVLWIKSQWLIILAWCRNTRLDARTNITSRLDSWYWVPTHQRIRDTVSKSFRTGRLERELQILQLSATRCSCTSILWVSIESFAAITLCVACQRVFVVVVVVYYVINSVRKPLICPRTCTSRSFHQCNQCATTFSL